MSDEAAQIARSMPLSTSSRRRRAAVLHLRGWTRPERPQREHHEARVVEAPAPESPPLVTPPPAPLSAPVFAPPSRSLVRRTVAQQESARVKLRSLIHRISGLAWVFTGDSLLGPAGNGQAHGNERLREFLQAPADAADQARDVGRYRNRVEALRDELRERTLGGSDVILICTGTNEARAGMKGLELFEHQLALIVEDVLAAGAVPVLCTPPAVRGGATVDQAVYVEAIRAAAAEYDVPLVDYWREWERTTEEIDVDRWFGDAAAAPGRNGHVELVHKLVSDMELQTSKTGKVYG
jgi:acyl-CoA thioesterase-1